MSLHKRNRIAPPFATIRVHDHISALFSNKPNVNQRLYLNRIIKPMVLIKKNDSQEFSTASLCAQTQTLQVKEPEGFIECL